MRVGLKKAGIKPEDVDYINAHGTSTPLGDELELGAVRRLFGSAIANVSMSSTQSAIGHLLGGAGAVESIFCILSLRAQIVPPTPTTHTHSATCPGVDLVPPSASSPTVRAVRNKRYNIVV